MFVNQCWFRAQSSLVCRKDTPHVAQWYCVGITALYTACVLLLAEGGRWWGMDATLQAKGSKCRSGVAFWSMAYDSWWQSLTQHAGVSVAGLFHLGTKVSSLRTLVMYLRQA